MRQQVERRDSCATIAAINNAASTATRRRSRNATKSAAIGTQAANAASSETLNVFPTTTSRLKRTMPTIASVAVSAYSRRVSQRTA